MFRKVHVPLLGLVENMSCFTCPQCGHSEAIFGEGGGAATAAELGMELLGQVGGEGHVGCVCAVAELNCHLCRKWCRVLCSEQLMSGVCCCCDAGWTAAAGAAVNKGAAAVGCRGAGGAVRPAGPGWAGVHQHRGQGEGAAVVDAVLDAVGRAAAERDDSVTVVCKV